MKKLWELFTKQACLLLKSIKPFAEDVRNKYGSLPLALVVMVSALRAKGIIDLSRHVLSELHMSRPSFYGIEPQVHN